MGLDKCSYYPSGGPWDWLSSSHVKILEYFFNVLNEALTSFRRTPGWRGCLGGTGTAEVLLGLADPGATVSSLFGTREAELMFGKPCALPPTPTPGQWAPEGLPAAPVPIWEQGWAGLGGTPAPAGSVCAAC